MMQNVILKKEQKEALVKASQMTGLSFSSFMRQATIEKLNRMGIQIDTSKGVNLDSSAPNTPIKGVDANARTS